MAARDDILEYSLRVGSLTTDDLVVTSFRGFETVSTLFSFNIEAVDSDSSRFLDLGDLVSKDAVFSFMPPHGHQRFVHGIIVAANALGWHEGRPRYQFELAPLLWRLGTGRRSRVFRDRSAVDIAKLVLKPAKTPISDPLADAYEQRELCLQFGESDLHFAWRLLESEGIHTFFEHDSSKTKLTFSDRIGKAPDSGAVLPYRPPTNADATEEHVAWVSQTQQLRPGAITLRDFNPSTPAVNLESIRNGAGVGTDIEVYAYPGNYKTPDAGVRRARLLLDEIIGDARVFNVHTDSARLLPGFSFEVTDHPVDAFNRKLVALSVLHVGDRLGYRNEVLALPSDAAWRPPRVTPRPFVPGIQTAIVVGVAGEEIDTDPDGLGRIKVRFHWERATDEGDAGSCWLRTSQAWAGPGMGTLFLPRIGHEVIVRFLEGNPDRPIIVGSVYNGANPPPATLPADKTQSILRSSSSPGGGGSNELRFEDASSQEEIFVHAQKDESIVVENDKSQEIRGIEILTVQKDRSQTIDQNQTLVVNGNDVAVVEKNQTLTVVKGRLSMTAGGHDETVGGSQSITVGGAHVLTVATESGENIGAAKSIAVGGALALTVGQDLSTGVGGSFTRKVVGAHKSFVTESLESIVAGNSTSDVNGKVVLDIDGAFALDAQKDYTVEISGDDAQHTQKILTIEAKVLQAKADKLTFSVNGKLLLEMAKSGAIKLNAATLTVDGPLKTKASKVDKTAAGSAPTRSASPPKPEELQAGKGRRSQLASVKMKGPGGLPIAGLKFEAKMPDGSVKRGRLAGDGSASVPAPDSGDVKFTFPDLDKGEWE